MGDNGTCVALQEVGTGRHDLVYGIQHGFVEDNIRGLEVVDQMVLRARTDNHAADGRMVQGKGDSKLDEGEPMPFGDTAQGIGRQEFVPVERCRDVEAPGNGRRAGACGLGTPTR